MERKNLGKVLVDGEAKAHLEWALEEGNLSLGGNIAGFIWGGGFDYQVIREVVSPPYLLHVRSDE